MTRDSGTRSNIQDKKNGTGGQQGGGGGSRAGTWSARIKDLGFFI